jgi:hypothetical protein
VKAQGNSWAVLFPFEVLRFGEQTAGLYSCTGGVLKKCPPSPHSPGSLTPPTNHRILRAQMYVAIAQSP